MVKDGPGRATQWRKEVWAVEGGGTGEFQRRKNMDISYGDKGEKDRDMERGDRKSMGAIN